MPRIFFAEFSAQKKMTASHKTTFLVEARGLYNTLCGWQGGAREARDDRFQRGENFFFGLEKKKVSPFCFFPLSAKLAICLQWSIVIKGLTKSFHPKGSAVFGCFRGGLPPCVWSDLSHCVSLPLLAGLGFVGSNRASCFLHTLLHTHIGLCSALRNYPHPFNSRNGQIFRTGITHRRWTGSRQSCN